MRWIKKRVGPPADMLATLQDLELVKSSAEVFLLGFFEDFKARLICIARFTVCRAGFEEI